MFNRWLSRLQSEKGLYWGGDSGGSSGGGGGSSSSSSSSSSSTGNVTDSSGNAIGGVSNSVSTNDSSSNSGSFANTVASWTSDESVIDAYRSPSINVGSSSPEPSFADTVSTWTSDTSVIDAYKTSPTVSLEDIYGDNAETFFDPTPFSPDYRDLAVNTTVVDVTPIYWDSNGGPAYPHVADGMSGDVATSIPVGDRTVDGMVPMESYVISPAGDRPNDTYTDEVMDYQLNKAITQEEQMAEAFKDEDYVVTDYKDDVYRYTTDSRDSMRYGVDYAETLARASGQAFQTQGPLNSYVRDPSLMDTAVSKVTGELYGDVNKPFVIDPVKGVIAEITDDHEIIDSLSQVFSAVTGIGMTIETAEAIATDGSGQMYSYRSAEGTIPSLMANVFGVETHTLRTQEEQKALDEKAREAQFSGGGSSGEYTAPAPAAPVTETPATNRSAAAYLNPILNTVVSPTRVSFSTDYTDQTPYVNPYFRLYSSKGFRNAAYGGKIEKMAEGGVVQGQAPQQQGMGPSGFVGKDPEQVAESQTVADDVAMEVPEGTFVLNAAAVEFAGSADVKKMLVNAMGEAKRQGLDISTNDNTMSNDDAVSLLVSQGEVVIPPQLAKIIGYDKLNKINNRGVKETEQRLEEKQAQQQPDQQMACGGFAKKRAKGSEGMGEVADGGDSLKTHERLYLDFLAGKTDDITEADFNEDQLREIGRIVKERKARNDKWENELLELYSSNYPFRKNEAGENVDSEDNAWWYYQNPDKVVVEDEMSKLADKLRTFEESRGRTSISDYEENINEPVGGLGGYMDQREDVNYQVRASLGKFTAHDNPDGSVTIRDAYNYNHSEYDPSLTNFIMNIPNMGSLQNVAEVTARHMQPEHTRDAVINIPAEYLK
jgi:hypothetical protein